MYWICSEKGWICSGKEQIQAVHELSSVTYTSEQLPQDVCDYKQICPDYLVSGCIAICQPPNTFFNLPQKKRKKKEEEKARALPAHAQVQRSSVKKPVQVSSFSSANWRLIDTLATWKAFFLLIMECPLRGSGHGHHTMMSKVRQMNVHTWYICSRRSIFELWSWNKVTWYMNKSFPSPAPLFSLQTTEHVCNQDPTANSG